MYTMLLPGRTGNKLRRLGSFSSFIFSFQSSLNACWYLRFRWRPIFLNFANSLQQVLIEQDPVMPWHLHIILMVFVTACKGHKNTMSWVINLNFKLNNTYVYSIWKKNQKLTIHLSIVSRWNQKWHYLLKALKRLQKTGIFKNNMAWNTLVNYIKPRTYTCFARSVIFNTWYRMNSDEWWFSVLFTVPFGPPYCCEGAWPPLRPFLLWGCPEVSWPPFLPPSRYHYTHPSSS